ncbi:MAG TPA: radical SAM family heme chaperone HemW [Candidatus Udaeobacter sp.]|jgi:oxygen-independent coproporphyrinogen-3 oxidase|nr:radical SAM family heme chaperone HemW [Candidatus Udaeobacter sp.]
MGNGANHNCVGTTARPVGRFSETPTKGTTSHTDGLQFSRESIDQVRHIYLHIPFCARICPYCAFYKELLDPSQTWRFCEALLRELSDRLVPSTIYFGGGTPTALNIGQLELLLGGLRERLDLSQLVEWTIEANPGSVSARKATVLKRFGVNRISLGVQSWDDELLKLLGREHNAEQAVESFLILRDAGFTNINVDLMFGLPGQTVDQWRTTLGKTIALRPEHVSTYCLTYEEDTEFFLRHARGEFRQDADADAEFFEMTMAILEDAGYCHYEISNYARPGFESLHNGAYWLGEDYLGIGPSAVSTIGMQRWQNVCDYRAYIERVFSGPAPRGSCENLTDQMKRIERIALGLRTRDGISVSDLKGFAQKTDELLALGLLRQLNGNFVLTRRGKALADSVVEAFL